jgi:L-asparaginase
LYARKQYSNVLTTFITPGNSFHIRLNNGYIFREKQGKNNDGDNVAGYSRKKSTGFSWRGADFSSPEAFPPPSARDTIHKKSGKSMQKILILTTGGTIDKVYFDAKSAYEVGPPNVEIVLREMDLSVDYSVLSLIRKDSLDLTDEDREIILQAVLRAEEERILVTHGTDTMVQTAQYLAEVRGKTIVLTGALAPALFKKTDAVFNIGCALAAVQTLPPGVYIAMNGAVFPYDRVKKNLQKNKFEEL